MWQYDFTLFYSAGQQVLHGLSPYTVVDFYAPFPFAVLCVPLALPQWLAYLLYVALSVALLFRLMRWRMVWALLSFPVLFTLFVGQADLLFGLWTAPLLLAKPQVGFVVAPWLIHKFGWRGMVKAAISGAILLAVCFIIRPTWVTDWTTAMLSVTSYSIRDSSLFFLLPPTQKFVWPLLAGIAFIVALRTRNQKRSWVITSLFQPLSNIYSASALATWFGPLEMLLSWLAIMLVGGNIHSGAPMFLAVLPMLMRWRNERQRQESDGNIVPQLTATPSPFSANSDGES